MTSLSKNVYIGKFKNIYDRTIKMKPVDVKSSIYIEFGVENNNKNPKFEVGDHVRISKCKNIFAKYQMESEKVMVITYIKGQIKRHSIKISQQFPKPYKSYSGNVKLKQICLIMQQKQIQKEQQVLITSNLPAKPDLASLKAEVDKADIDRYTKNCSS